VIVLVGFMGAGKSSVGRLVASKLALPFIDTDANVVARAGRPIAEIFEEQGEPAFREIEREVVYEALEGPEAVVALGGGSLSDPGIWALLDKATVVHLDVSYAEAIERVGEDADRPMLQRDPRALYEERDAVYSKAADHTVTTDGRGPDEVAAAIRTLIGSVALDADVHRVLLPLGDRSYEIVVGRGLMPRLGAILPSFPDAEKAFFITHPSLEVHARPAWESLQASGLAVGVVLLPEGEASKSLAEVTRLYEKLAAADAHRHDVVVSFGGGVVSDAGGFVASTYARGMPLVNVPTTLLGQVDAAIGGKTGVNLPHGKNLVGTIYQPAMVVCDIDVLASCPIEEIRSGLAEVVKYGFIAEPDLLEYVAENADALLANDLSKLLEIVARSVAIKAAVVAGDEHESGIRAHLNYGHTFAHAIELNESFGGIRHGEAVAIGMMAAAYLARELDRIDDDVVSLHRRVLESVGLPVTASLDLDSLEAAWRLDKKYRRGVRFVLLAGLGKPEAGVEVPKDALEKTIERLAK
jgi:3-dehydroquinate synthase/shikimate kinase/3-dehydroquinate synthase